MVDADQHEGAGRAEARGLLDRFGERGDQMGAIEFAGQGIVLREFQQLFVAGVAFVVDADDTLRARRPAVGAGEPATGFLDPDHGGGGRGPHAIFDPVGDAFDAARRTRFGQARRTGSSAPARSAWRTRRRSPALPAGMSGKTAAALSVQAIASVARSQTKAACPSEARMLEACGTACIKVASIRDSSGDSGRPRIVALCESDARQSS